MVEPPLPCGLNVEPPQTLWIEKDYYTLLEASPVIGKGAHSYSLSLIMLTRQCQYFGRKNMCYEMGEIMSITPSYAVQPEKEILRVKDYMIAGTISFGKI